MNIAASYSDKIMASINKKSSRLFLLTGSLGKVTNVISTQAPSVDRTLACDNRGNWGFPCGKVSFVFSEPGVGKTTLMLHCCAEAQSRGGIAIFIDCEHRLDKNYAESIGVDVDRLIYGKPETLEEGLEIVEENIEILIREIQTLEKKTTQKDKAKAEAAEEELNAILNMPIFIAFDSTSIKTNAESRGSGEVGGHSRSISKHLRLIIGDVDRLNIAIVYVCQRKQKISTGYAAMFGPGETFLGESALRFHATVGIKLIRIKILKSGEDEDDKVGSIVKALNSKNSNSIPFKSGQFEIYFGKGINYYISLCSALEKYYGARKTGRKYKLKNPDVEWTDKGGLKKVFETQPKTARRIRKLLKKPARKRS